MGRRRRKTLHELEIGNQCSELPGTPDPEDPEYEIIDATWATAM